MALTQPFTEYVAQLPAAARAASFSFPAIAADGDGVKVPAGVVEYDFERDFGGTLTGDNSAALAAVYAQVAVSGSLRVKVSKPGTYLFSTPLGMTTLGGSLVIDWVPGAIWKCDTGYDEPLIYIRGSASAAGEDEIVLINPQIDMSDGDNSVQPSGINLTNFLRVYGWAGHLYGGPSRDEVGGDSGVETVNVKHFNWVGGVVEGWSDGGFYLNGGNVAGPSDNGGLHSLVGVTIKECGEGAIFKRDGKLMELLGCYIHDCNVGVVTAEVGPGQDQNTGQFLRVVGCTIERMKNWGISFRAKTKGEAIGNRIQDIGYEPDGVTPVAGQSFIRIQGASDININGNTCVMKDWTPTDQIGINISGYTDQAGDVWVGGDCSGSGNRFENVPVTILESGAATTVQSKFLANHISEMPFASSAMRSGTLFQFTEDTKTGLYTAAYLGSSPSGAATIYKDNIPRGTFRAYLSGDATLTTPTSPVVIPFDSEMEDFGGFFNAANGRWSPEVGLYLVNVRLRVSLVNNPELWTVQLRRNGGLPTDSAAWYQNTYSTSGETTLGGMVMIQQTSASDYWEIWLSASGGSNKVVRSALSHTSWSAVRIA